MGICLESGNRLKISTFRCIEKWIQSTYNMNRSSKPSSSSKCPTCNAPTKRSDIRIIFTTNVVAVDTQQLEAMEASLRVAKSAQVAAESQFSQLSSTITALQAELVWTQQKLKDSQDLLRKERILYRSEEKSSTKRFKSIRNGILEFKKSIALGAGAVRFWCFF